jgi:penicillin-binding protein 1A
VGPKNLSPCPCTCNEAEDAIDEALDDHPDNGDVMSALVLEADSKKIRAIRQNGETLEITGDGLDPRNRACPTKHRPTSNSARCRDTGGKNTQEHLGNHSVA